MRRFSPAIRLWDHGTRVVRLQRALQTLGYYDGEVDGRFGYLTQDAVLQFQREHRLRRDGIAGREVQTLLYADEVLGAREVHIVASREDLASVARQHGVSAEYLRRSNRLPARRPLYAGQRLLIRRRVLIGVSRHLDSAKDAAHVLRRYGRYLSGLGAALFRVNEEGDLAATWHSEALDLCAKAAQDVYAVVHNWSAGGEADDLVHRLLRNTAVRRRLLDHLVALGTTEGVRGVLLDFGRIPFGDGPRYARFVADLRDRLQRHERTVFAGVPVFAPSVRGRLAAAELDARKLAAAADGLVLQAHRPAVLAAGALPFDRLEAQVRAFTKRVGYRKAFLGLHLGAREYNLTSRTSRDLSYPQARALAYYKQAKPAWDEVHRSLTCTYGGTEEGEHLQLWLESGESLARKLHWVERYNLSGTVLWTLGDEDARLWPILPRFVSALQHDPSRTGI